MQQHEEERRDQNRNERAGSLLDWAMHVAAKSVSSQTPAMPPK